MRSADSSTKYESSPLLQSQRLAKRWVPIALAGSLGLGAGLLIAPKATQAPSKPVTLAGTDPDQSQQNGSPHGGDRSEAEAEAEGTPAPVRPRVGSIGSPSAADPSREAELAREVTRLESKARSAQGELEAARERLEALEGAEQRRQDPRQFDLTPEDWRELGRRGTLKLRVPCPGPDAGNLSQAQLDNLGLAPADGPVVAAAFRHSAERVWGVVGPLCAEALGGTEEQAAAVGARSCRHLILKKAAEEGTVRDAYRRAAAFLAGDAEQAPDAERSAVERLVLALSQEQRLVKEELAESFGPDEADRLVFSRELCFTEATHELGQPRTTRSSGATGP